MPGRRAVTLAALLVAAPYALMTTPAARAADQQAYAAGLSYVTPVVVAGRGDTLRFTNLDALARHDLDSDVPGLFDSPLVGTNESTTVRGVAALPPGQYAFHCSVHAWMHGVLTVGAAGVPVPQPPPPPSPGQTPNPVDLLPKVAPEPLGPGDWPFYGRDLANSRNGGTAGPSWNEVATLGPVWSVHSGDGDFTGTPVVADGTLIAGAGGGTVLAIDAATGALRWSRDLNQPINGSAAISGGRVFVPLAQVSSPRVVALDLATGAVLWDSVVDAQHESDVFGSPVVWNGTVFIGTSGEFAEVNDPKGNVRGSVVALDAATGDRVWKTYTVPVGRDGGAVWSTPAIDTATGRLFVGTGNAYHAPAAPTTDSILALDTGDGHVVGHFQATAGDVWNMTSNISAGPDADFGSSPNLLRGAGGRRLVGGGQKAGTYWALDRSTLKPAWKTTIGPGSSVGGVLGSTAFDGRRVYGPNTPLGEMWALRATDGLPAWVSADGGPLHFGSIAVANGVVYSSDMSGQLIAREATTGVPLATLPLGAPSWGGIAIAGGSVFAVTGTGGTGGYVVAYRVRD